MAHSTLVLEKNGVQKQCPVGFSWTTFFFGGFPAIIRGHVLMGLVLIILQFITFGLSSLVFAFIYNKMYINWRLENGFNFVEVSGAKSKSLIEESLGIKLKDNNDSDG